MTTKQVWDELSNHLLNFILSKVPVREDAEDLLTEVFEKIHLNLNKLESEQKLESWVFTITRNAINDYYKKGKPTTEVEDKLTDEIEITQEEDLIKQLQRCMVNMMHQLPEKYHKPLVMSELEGKKQQEVADILGLSLPGAKSRVQRGKQMLKEMLVECCKVDINSKGQVKAGSVTEMNCNC